MTEADAVYAFFAAFAVAALLTPLTGRLARRVGASALATRGLQVEDFHEVGRIIAAALSEDFDAGKADLAERVTAIADRYPLYEHLSTQAAAV